jgi:hypothetical protein
VISKALRSSTTWLSAITVFSQVLFASQVDFAARPLDTVSSDHAVARSTGTEADHLEADDKKTRLTCDQLDPQLFDSLMDWIEENTSYDVSMTRIDPPSINWCHVGDSIDYEGDQVLVEPDLIAAYDSVRREILLVRPWNSADARDQSVLLHELIHDVQSANREWYCQQQPEWEAYHLQDKWLAEHGLESSFDWLYIYFLSRCLRDHHP